MIDHLLYLREIGGLIILVGFLWLIASLPIAIHFSRFLSSIISIIIILLPLPIVQLYIVEKRGFFGPYTFFDYIKTGFFYIILISLNHFFKEYTTSLPKPLKFFDIVFYYVPMLFIFGNYYLVCLFSLGFWG
jgi:hypothetical protein